MLHGLGLHILPAGPMLPYTLQQFLSFPAGHLPCSLKVAGLESLRPEDLLQNLVQRHWPPDLSRQFARYPAEFLVDVVTDPDSRQARHRQQMRLPGINGFLPWFCKVVFEITTCETFEDDPALKTQRVLRFTTRPRSAKGSDQWVNFSLSSGENMKAVS